MNWFNKNKNKFVLFVALVLIQMILIDPVLAAGIGFAAPDADDMSVSFLNQIFGGLVNKGSDAFGASIGVFNGAILTIGGILAAYTILSGTIGTAHDGEMLGKKFSSIWIPIRYSLGTALVLPVMGGGYCVMQSLVMWVVMQGISLANLTWIEYISNSPELKAKITMGNKAQLLNFVKGVYQAQVCVEARKKASTKSPAILGLGKYDYKFALVGNEWLFGDHGGVLFKGNKKECGSVFNPPPMIIQPAIAAAASVKSLAGVESIYQVANLTPIHDAHMKNIASIITATGILAKSNIDTKSGNDIKEMQILVDKYYNDLVVAGNAVSAQNNAVSSMTQAAKKQGWFLAGTWVTQIIMAQGKINAALNFIPTWSYTSLPPPSELSDVDGIYQADGIGADVRGTPQPIKISSTDKPAAPELTDGGKVAQIMGAWATKIDLKQIKDDQRHPLLIMQNVGESMLDAILVALGVVVGLSAVTSMVSTAPVVAIFITLAMPLATFIGVGAMLAYILPNLPFLIWIGIIIGWTIMVVEAIIAAPLWAIMHLHPNGDDLTGKGANGYMLLLGLLLRPVLIIFGLIAAIVLSGLFGQLINKIFFDIFNTNMGGGGLGFFATVFGTAIYASLMMVIIKQTFNLMHVIPDQLLRWIGGGNEQLGQYAGGFSGDGMAKASAIGGAAAGFMAKDALSAGANALGQAKQSKGANDNKKAIQAQTAQDKEMAQSASDKAQSASDGKFNKDVGASDDLAGQISESFAGQGSGGELTLAQTQQGISNAQTEVSNNNASLGGSGSEAAETYKSELSSNMSQGQSFKDANTNALSTAADEKFGKGAGGAIEKLGKEGQSTSKILSSLNAKQNNIQENTGDSSATQSKMSGMFSRANEMMESNTSNAGQPPSSFSEAMKNASAEVNSSFSAKEAEQTPEPEPSPSTNTSLPTIDTNFLDSQIASNSGNPVQGDLFSDSGSGLVAPPPPTKKGDDAPV